MNIGAENRVVMLDNLKIGYPASGRNPGFRREFITLSADAGETVALIGPNGAGKSTLLRTITGLLPSLSGNCLLSGKPVHAFKPAEIAANISFVSTENIISGNMRVYDLVAYGRFPYTNWLGKLSDNDHKKVADALAKAGLTPLAGRLLNEISDGERQRAFIARAVAQDTPLIVLDEPTSFLDVSNKYEIFHLLHQLAHRDRKTIILSTHDMGIALREMDKLWIMAGQDNLEGAPEDAILNGWIGRLFSNEHLGFDDGKREFYFRREAAGTAVVEGSGIAYGLTREALERKGFRLVIHRPADIEVVINADNRQQAISWELSKENITTRHHSLYSLLSAL